MVLSSTSPATTGHVFWDFIDDAERAGRHIHIPVTANISFTEQDRKVLLSLCKGEDTPAWRREALCLRVADESLLAVPSFSVNRESIVAPARPPEAFFTVTCADIGYIDPTAILFIYIDFERHKYVVQDEIVGSTIGTAELIRLIKEKEKQLWGNTLLWDQTVRWADCTPRERSDLAHAGLFLSPARPEGWDKWRTLAFLESCFAQGLIEVDPKCKSLIHQLANAVKNTHHTDLKREAPPEYRDPAAPIMGHQDALWALSYAVERARYLLGSSPFLTARNRRGTWEGHAVPMLQEITLNVKPLHI